MTPSREHDRLVVAELRQFENGLPADPDLEQDLIDSAAAEHGVDTGQVAALWRAGACPDGCPDDVGILLAAQPEQHRPHLAAAVAMLAIAQQVPQKEDLVTKPDSIAETQVEQGAARPGEFVDLLGLASEWELERPPRHVGDSLDIYLTHAARGSVELTFYSLTDFTSQRSLTTLLAARCGRRGKPPTMEKIYSALALACDLADRHETETEDEIARSWGENFLEQAGEHQLDWSDQEDRWRALVDVRDAEAQIKEDLRHAYYAARHSVVVKHAFVLLDVGSGRRFVHAGWFFSHVKDQGATGGRGAVSQAMRRVGWERPGSLKLWAREPGGTARKLGVRAYVVPADWTRE